MARFDPGHGSLGPSAACTSPPNAPLRAGKKQSSAQGQFHFSQQRHGSLRLALALSLRWVYPHPSSWPQHHRRTITRTPKIPAFTLRDDCAE